MDETPIMRLPSAGRGGGGERFNYKGMHRYIITQPVHPGNPVFSRPEPVFGALNVLRDCGVQHKFDIYAYCFMPDRLILLIRGKDESSDMKDFLSAFRSGSNAALETALGHPLWSRKYTERVLRKTEETRVIARDIFAEPVKAGIVSSANAYQFLGSFVTEPAKILSIPNWEKKGGPPMRGGQFRGGASRGGPSGGGRPFRGGQKPSGNGRPGSGFGKRPPGRGKGPFGRGKPGGGPGRKP